MVDVIVGQPSGQTNLTSTRRYNWLTFLPLSILFQFRKMNNLYFLLTVCINFVPDVSVVDPYASIAPLAAVVLISVLREFIEEIGATRRDSAANHAGVLLVTRTQVDFKTRMVDSCNVRAGDVLLIRDGERIPCDCLVLVSPSNPVYVETSNLDGEINLKPKQPTVGGVYDIQLDRELNRLVGSDCLKVVWDLMIKVDSPHSDMYKLDGMCDKEVVNLSNFMLAGCTVKNTAWAIVVAVHVGANTKSGMNAKTGFLLPKITHADSKLGMFVIVIFSVQLVLVIAASTVAYMNSQTEPHRFWYLRHVKILNWVVYACSAFVLLSVLIPVSLWVATEFIRFFQTFFIEWDDKGNGIKCKAKNLNEELGQLTHVFSDKTGTLTQNRMQFVGCATTRRSFKSADPAHGAPRVYFQGVTPPPADLIKTMSLNLNDEELKRMMSCLAVCHTCDKVDSKADSFTEVHAQPVKCFVSNQLKAREMTPMTDLPRYQSTSPDEAALVLTAGELGIHFIERSSTTITTEEGQLTILRVIPFTSERRCMSVLTRNEKTGETVLFTKGADTAILPRLRSDQVVDFVSSELDAFAGLGYRTLVVACRAITDWEDYYVPRLAAAAALGTLEERILEMASVDDALERDFTLLGCTAVEDKLQENVGSTCTALRNAGVKVSMITGDKMETAINVARACQILSSQRIIGASYFDERTSFTEEPLCLVLEGDSLARVLASEASKRRFELLLQQPNLESAVFCRVNPKQKGDIVHACRSSVSGSVVLAIGDGANDVSMIRRAHVGVGIRGVEGSQAANCADFAISKFSDLHRLVFVHGRVSLYRTSTFIKLFLYKNIIFALCQFWYAIPSRWSFQTIYSAWYIQLYNSLFMIFPLFSLALFDHDMHADLDYCEVKPERSRCSSLRGYSYIQWMEVALPRIYVQSSREYRVTFTKFLPWLAAGIIHSAIILNCHLYASSFVAGPLPTSLGAISISVYTTIFFTVQTVVAWQIHEWTWVQLSAFTVNTVLYVAWVFFYDVVPGTFVFQVARSLVGGAPFWTSFIIFTSACVLPMVAVCKWYNPDHLISRMCDVPLKPRDYMNNL